MNTAKLKVTAGCRDLLGVQKHANQHRLSRLVMEVHNDELRIIAAAVESYTDELIAALEAAEKRNAELEAVKNWWKPERCPVTNRPFFLWIEHPSDGMVPTYGGPFDSYTIPTVDSDGEFCCERYDHDVGAWVDSECLSVRLTGGEA